MLDKELAVLFVFFTSVSSLKGIKCIILHILLNVDHNKRTVISVFSKQFFVISWLEFTERVVCLWKGRQRHRGSESSADFSEFWTTASVLLPVPKSKALASLA